MSDNANIRKNAQRVSIFSAFFAQLLSNFNPQR